MHPHAVTLMWIAVVALPALPAVAIALKRLDDGFAARHEERIRQRTGALRKRRAF